MKIPKPIRRGDAWRICVTFKGQRFTSTHDTDPQAREWAARKLLELKDAERRGESGELPQHTLGEAISLYIEKVSILKAGYRWENLRLNKLKRDNPTLSNKMLEKLKSIDFVNYRDKRIKEVSGTTVSREMELLGGVLNYCIRELGWLNKNPMSTVSRPAEAPPRNMRASDAEIELILEKCKYSRDEPLTTKYHEVGWCTLFAVETAMRMSEITGMRWADVHLDRQYVHLPNTKNGDARNVPLSVEAERLLRQAKGLDKDRVLTIESASLSTMFRRVRDAVGLPELHFHDLRHEAATRMAQIIKNPADLAKITGHKDVNILVNTYYNPTAQELAGRLRGG